MITFRARGPESLDWTLVTLDGDDEEVLSHAVATLLASAGWETLVAEGSEEPEPLSEGWL